MLTAAKNILDEHEVAELLSVKPQTLATWRMKGIGPRYAKVGRLVRYRLADLERWMEENTVATGSK